MLDATINETERTLAMPSRFFSRHRAAALALAAALATLAPQAARADAIDGDWCNAEGKHLAIKGNEITLPDGSQLQGAYTRHSFAYTVPENQPAAGTQMILRLVNEDNLLAAAYRGPTPPEPWKRCEHVS